MAKGMKRLHKWRWAPMMVLLLLASSAWSADTQYTPRRRGGPMGFVAGCCFGVRAAADYNDRLDIHWREFARWIPGLGLAFALWDGIDGYRGTTRVELSARHGSVFYGAVFY